MNWMSQRKYGLTRATAAATLWMSALLTAVPSVQADQNGYADAWGPSLHVPMPLLAAPDQDGVRQNLASLTGENGRLVLFNRSAVW